MNDMENLRTFADQLWKYMVPKLDSKFASNVSYFRAEVVSNPGDNKLEVQRPVENGTLTLPCVRAMSGAQAGQQVVALVMGSMSNAIIVGDGKLNVPGGGGDAGIANFQAQPDGSLVITLTNGVTFTATPIMDDVPTRGSNLAVKSGGIYTALNGKADNAFANVQVGSTTISADNNADTLTLNAGGLVSLTGNATNDSVTISVDPNHTHITTQVLDLVNADSYGPSGMVSFDADVSEVPLKSCLVEIKPAQEGSGDPSPSNIRPISGWTGAKVFQSGKNMLRLETKASTSNGVSFAFDQNAGTIHATGASTAAYSTASIAKIRLGQGSYIISGCPSSGGANKYIIRDMQYTADNTFVRVVTDAGSGGTIAVTDETIIHKFDIVVYSGAGTVDVTFQPMLRHSTGTDATFEPFKGEFFDITFPSEAGTVYGGTLDVLKGTLTVNTALVTLTGNESASYTWGAYCVPVANAMRSEYEIIPVACTHTDNYITGNRMWRTEGSGEDVAVAFHGYGALFFRNRNVGTTLSAYQTYLRGQASAGTPVQVVYKIATPITYQLSPQIISTLLGNNNIWADCGTISVEYGAFLSALDKAIEEHSDDDIRHITEAERETWDSKADSPHTHDASDIVSGILPAARGGTGNGNGYIQIGQKAGTTLGNRATAEGHNTMATGNRSHSEGTETESSGVSSHAEGAYTVAGGTGSHAEGDHTTTTVDYAHAEGGYTLAKGNYSHAEGYYTIAAANAQHVFGRYNIEDSQNIEIVGWGKSSARKNIRTLSEFGNEWIAGTLTQASDARLKDVQGEIPDLSSIRAVRFRWKNGDDKEHLGYLAQDVEGVAPYLVGVDSNGYKSLDYIALLTAKVEMLEREVMELKGR